MNSYYDFVIICKIYNKLYFMNLNWEYKLINNCYCKKNLVFILFSILLDKV